MKREKGANNKKNIEKVLIKRILLVFFVIFAFSIIIISQIKEEPVTKRHVTSPVLEAISAEVGKLKGYELGKKMFEYELEKAKALGATGENLPFLIENPESSKGILLLHGFGASPWEVKELGEYMAEKGLTVYAPLIEGHGTKGEDMNGLRWEDWYSSAEYSYRALSEMVDEVYVAGLSMGGDLSLILASRHDLKGVISINAPIYLVDKRARLVWAFKYVKSEYKRDLTEEEKNYYYETIPTDAVFELLILIRETQSAVSDVTEPIMIMQALDDQTADPASAEFIDRNVASEDKKVVWYQKGTHVIIKEEEKEDVFKEIYDMIANGT
jgi:carboxylesterase